MPKNEIKAKSTTRKPLRDASNGVRSSKSVKNKAAPRSDDRVQDDAHDRLLLVHSDLSSLILQVDELVVQALKVMSKEGKKEIESFTQVLSEIQSSLKPWASRLQKAVSSQSVGSDYHLGQSLVSTTTTPIDKDTSVVARSLEQNKPSSQFIGSENQLGLFLVSRTDSSIIEDISDAIQSPEQTNFESLVSPSPLVSWRADCTTEGGRQLFLLTPLPRQKAFSSKLEGSSKSAFEKKMSNITIGQPSPIAISGKTNDDLLEDVIIKPTPSKVSDPVGPKRDSILEPASVSPPNFSKNGCSMLVMTPCLKMSPPKSCVLLEPISEQSHRDSHMVRKSTPFPVGIHDLSGSQISESSSSEVSENFALKYLELFGIQPHMIGNGRKGLEKSPDWVLSPPKTCILMEPCDEKALTNGTNNGRLPRAACVQSQQIHSTLVKINSGRSDSHLTRKICCQELGGSSEIIDSTPLWKEPETATFQTGKHAGENTLKKELWTRFEAASTHGIHFNVSALQETAKRGFLDRLDEVSCDETSTEPRG